MNASELTTAFATALKTNEKFVQTRLIALGHATECSRCGGCGNYSFCPAYGTTCFKCQGQGKVATKLTAKLLKTVQAEVESGKLQPYLDNLAHRQQMNKLIAALPQEIMNAWKNLPTKLKDKAEGRDHHTTQSKRQTDLNHFCCPLSTEADDLAREIKNGRWSKELKGFVKLTTAEVEPLIERMKAILEMVKNAETIAPEIIWSKELNRYLEVAK